MNTTSSSLPLARFRAELYQTVVGMRRDARCDLLDAVLTGEQAPGCPHGWANLI